MTETILTVDELYPKYYVLVKQISYRFTKLFPHDDLDDLTQSCWEQIITQYPSFDATKGKLHTWLSTVCKGTLYNMLRADNTNKRRVKNTSISLDGLFKKFNHTL